MRVKELADLAGTTVRTVRHYHHVGLLPVPAMLGAKRDYGLDHLARVLRVRWLAGSGMSLGAIAKTLGEMRPAPGAPGLEELTAMLADIDVRMAELIRQRERVAALVDRARAGGEVNPLPPSIVRLYDRLIPRLPERARRSAESERKVVTILALRGMVPESLERLADEITEDDDRDGEIMFIAFSDLSTASGSDEESTVIELRDAVLRFVDRHEDTIAEILQSFPRGAAGAAKWGLLRRLAMLGYPAAAQRRFLDALPELLDERPHLRAAFTGADAWALR